MTPQALPTRMAGTSPCRVVCLAERDLLSTDRSVLNPDQNAADRPGPVKNTITMHAEVVLSKRNFGRWLTRGE